MTTGELGGDSVHLGQAGSSASVRKKSHGRRLGVAVASLALIVGGTVSNNLTAGANDAAPQSAIGPYDPNNFNNGEAMASGQAFRFNITQGNANVGYSYGSVLAFYRDATGKADARALDLGVIPTLFGVEQCDGSPPILNPKTFPPLTLADSTEAGSEIPVPADAFMPSFKDHSAGPKVGTQIATATPLPSSKAETVSENADLFFLALKGAKSEATTSLKDHVREARSVVSATELRIMSDLFIFKDPRWEAVARSGRVNEVTGSFTFRKAYVLGQPRTQTEALRDLDGFKKGLEDLLKPLGAKLELPTVVVTDNKVEVTPMSFKLVDPPFGADLIKPFLNNIGPALKDFRDKELERDCKNETNLMTADLLLGILSGSGTIEIHTGGADAWTDDTDFTVPAAEFTPQPESTIEGTPAVEAVAAVPAEEYEYDLESEYIPGTEGYDGYDDYDDYDDYADDTEDYGDQVDEEVLSDELVDDTPVDDGSENDRAQFAGRDELAESKGGTAAVAVGLAGLLGAIGLTFGEHIKERRTRRRIP